MLYCMSIPGKFLAKNRSMFSISFDTPGKSETVLKVSHPKMSACRLAIGRGSENVRLDDDDDAAAIYTT
jgi:hypothetical protein